VVSDLLDTWSSLYSNHAALRTSIEFLHIGGLVAGGGCAVAADRMTLMAIRNDAGTRALRLAALKGIHRVVLAGLVVIIVSGVLMFGADVDMFLYSKAFWLKMGLMLLLMANGAVLVRAERRVEHGDPTAWTQLKYTATASLALWFLTTLAGSALPNIG
jgi:uncharacterized membrane protein